jgi:hypothetical protein
MLSLVAGLTLSKSLGVHTEDHICIKTHAKASPEYNTIKANLLQTIVHDMG